MAGELCDSHDRGEYGRSGAIKIVQEPSFAAANKCNGAM